MFFECFFSINSLMYADCCFIKKFSVVYLAKAHNYFISAKANNTFHFIKRNVIGKLAYKGKSWMHNEEGETTYIRKTC